MSIRIVLCACMLLLRAAPASPQNYFGVIRGTVRDADGVVSAAHVSCTEDATGLARTVVTNDRGDYQCADLPPGIYTVRATAPGYRAAEYTRVAVGTRAFVAVDAVLAVGRVTESISVEARPPLTDASSASIGTLLDRATLDSQPTAGRNVFIMAAARATVIATGDSQFVRQQDQSNSSLISIGGGPRRNNSYVLDGVPIVDILNRATFIPSLEAVEEVRVHVSAYDAEVGRTSGGVFNVVGRSGSNAWRGSARYQNRPGWGSGRLFFADKNDIETPDTYYHLYAGGVGGPIVRNRTFFWSSTEGYRTATARNTVLVLPTAAERLGDFSGSDVTIYDPLTTRPDPANPAQFIRDPFPGNRIPAERLNPVARALVGYLPSPAFGRSRPAVADIVDRADQATGRVTHRWSDVVTTTGLYAWYTSMEPDARFYGSPLFENGADPGDGALVRRVHMTAVNTTWTRASSVVHVRYGVSEFLDDNRPAAFDPGPLGFDPAFLAAVPLAKFPGIGVSGYGRGGALLGDRSRDTNTYDSQNAAASVATIAGRHSIKFGGEWRTTGVRFVSGGGTGGYNFDRGFTTGPDPNAPGAQSGDAFATFLLGYPASGGISLSTPLDVRLTYRSAFVQDDVTVGRRLTLNLGLRYEYESGLRERDDRLVVGWDFDTPFPVQVGGLRPDGSPLALTGGVRYAGVDGAPVHQGDPRPLQFAPRAGVAYAAGDRTAIRGGYGLFWAPSQGISPDEGGTGTTGYNQFTQYVATGANRFVPCDSCSLTNPFPAGITPPRGRADGRLTGVGGSIGFVDPRSRMGRLHRYSIDVQRELPGQFGLSVAYLGARGADLGGGIGTAGININQLDPKYFALGTRLQEPVVNPFFGTPLGVGILATPTVARGQLLRPYPQFDGVYMNRANVARSRYDALVLTAERRSTGGLAVHADYTWSRARDSQYSESNFFSGGSGILNNYDIDAEYALSVVDTPHRANVTAWISIRGGWTVAATAGYQSGFPVSVAQSPNNASLMGSGQRPNVVPGVDPYLSRDAEDAYERSCGCIRWLNPAAWSQAAPFTFGTAPRTDGRVRTPARRNLDLALTKAARLAGRTISVRAELINAFNVADLRGPGIVFGDPSFGQIRDAAGFPRMLQVTARVAW